LKKLEYEPPGEAALLLTSTKSGCIQKKAATEGTQAHSCGKNTREGRLIQWIFTLEREPVKSVGIRGPNPRNYQSKGGGAGQSGMIERGKKQTHENMSSKGKAPDGRGDRRKEGLGGLAFRINKERNEKTFQKGTVTLLNRHSASLRP